MALPLYVRATEGYWQWGRRRGGHADPVTQQGMRAKKRQEVEEQVEVNRWYSSP